MLQFSTFKILTSTFCCGDVISYVKYGWVTSNIPILAGDCDISQHFHTENAGIKPG